MSRVGSPGIGAGIAAVLLPPLGVWLVAGVGRDFWIAVALTCLFFVPGIAWALFVLFRGGIGAKTARRPVATAAGPRERALTSSFSLASCWACETAPRTCFGSDVSRRRAMFRKMISAGMLGAVAALSLASAPADAQFRGYRGNGGGYHDPRNYGNDGYYRGGGGHRGHGYYDGGDRRGPRGYGRYRRNCDRGTGGTIIGAIAGGLLGNTVTGRGDHTVGTIVGAGAGALAGRAIDRDC